MSYIQGIKHPEAFHGENRSKNFFEGWYVKLVSKDLSQRYAIIPGIFRGLRGSDLDEAFIQVLDGITGKSWYHKFEIKEFKASPERFEVRIGKNYFSKEKIVLDLPGIKGTVKITSELDPWPVTRTSPGIMGWYGLVPFMECFHGIVSFGHSLSGALVIDGKKQSFAGGRGYIEKDWGRNFPEGYLWLHSNHFELDKELSLVASAAIIPWLGKPFRGYIMGLRHSGKLYRWTTYNRSKEELLEITDHEVKWRVSGKDGTLELCAKRVRGGLLHAPLRGQMHKRVEETLDGQIEITHTLDGKILRQGTAICGAMEIFGDIEKLLKI